MWVMTISENLQEINFYDPYLMKEYCLKDRINNRQMLQWFLAAKKINLGAIQTKLDKFSSHIDMDMELYKSNSYIFPIIYIIYHRNKRERNE